MLPHVSVCHHLGRKQLPREPSAMDDGLKKKKKKTSHHHGAGCFSPRVAAAFLHVERHNANAQEHSCKNSLSHFPSPSLPLSNSSSLSQSVNQSFFHRQPRTFSFSALWMLSVLTFSLAECASPTPLPSPLLLFLPPLPPFPSVSSPAIFCPASLHARPASP